MFDDLLDKLNRLVSIRERLTALNETRSWEQIALALYSIPESSEALRIAILQHQIGRLHEAKLHDPICSF